MSNSFNSETTLSVNGKEYTIYSLKAVEEKCPQAAQLPFCHKILLENLLVSTASGSQGPLQGLGGPAKRNGERRFGLFLQLAAYRLVFAFSFAIPHREFCT